MKSAEIRQAFLDYFNQQNHTVVSSSALVPDNDPTLLFVNAGMVPFKDVFLGQDQRSYKRATSVQRCVRAGGKHNDLENVGYTARHHTFFEMLGNFSFGDYFKRDAIKFAWTFLTQILKLPEERLWVTIYKDDDEAAAIWLEEMGVSPERFSRLGEKDNFWMMGDTGPCGPSSEIFFDHGDHIAGGPPGSPDDDLDRYIEIWNLVFMQYEKQSDGSLVSLPKPSVDTGMGLERIAAVMQGVHNNYDIDIFQHLLKAASEVTQRTDRENKSLRVIADHIRSTAFLIADGVLPSNEGRGYVLRRIIRRALRHGHKLGVSDLFFHKLVPALIEVMGEAYPEICEQQTQVERVLKLEEEQFAKTLDKGMKILDAELLELNGSVLSGETAFKLYDTYGFPLDLTADIAREKGITVDQAGFDASMQRQRLTAQAASQFGKDYTKSLDLSGTTEFLGYEKLQNKTKVLAIYDVEGNKIERINQGETGLVVLEATAFYAESGGQAGDQGRLTWESGIFDVVDTTKEGHSFIHRGHVLVGTLSIDSVVKTEVHASQRRSTAINHSATHLLHAALRNVLGDHVTQKGSLVTHERLRFDFSHFEAVTSEQIQAIEQRVNEAILRNTSIETQVMNIEDAKKQGAMALFGEKYDDHVRVLSMDQGFSVELCGGTHASHTGDLGSFKIISEGGVAAGVRRIEAIAGSPALQWATDTDTTLKSVMKLVKGSREDVVDKVEQLIAKSRLQEKEVERLKSKLATSVGGDLASQAEVVNGVNFLAANLEGADTKSLRSTMDQLKNKLGSGVIVLATGEGSKVTLLAGVTKDLTGQFKAGDIVNAAAELVSGRGGGKPEMAQAGGKNPAAIPEALEAAKAWLANKV